MRIASLLPSATEIVTAVGAGDELVGVSHECDYPAGVGDLPTLTRVRDELPRSSAGIDQAIREILTEALTVYEVDVDRLSDVRPDVIVTQDLCDVCAVGLDDVRRAARDVLGGDVDIVSLSPTRLSEVLDDVRTVGRALGRESVGDEAAETLQKRLDELRARTSTFGHRPTVLTVEWIDPVMIGGTWMPELVEIAGGTALVTEPGHHAPTLSINELRRLDPEFVLVKPCGFELERTREERDVLARALPLDDWSRARVWVADGNAYFNRPGPRLVESAEILAACMWPDECRDLAERHAGSFVEFSAL